MLVKFGAAAGPKACPLLAKLPSLKGYKTNSSPTVLECKVGATYICADDLADGLEC